MNDNIISISAGSLTGITTGIINSITFLEVWEIALFGFIGGTMGYIAKVLVKQLISLIKPKKHV